MKQLPKSVLYLLDCGCADDAALRLLRVFVGGQELQLTGLVVEDEDLVRAMRLPGLSEVSIARLEAGPLQPERLRKDILAHTEAVRERFEKAARGISAEVSFQVRRGPVSDVLLEAAHASDFVVVTRPQLITGLRARSASTFQNLLAQHGNVLFVNEPWQSGSRIVVLCPASGADVSPLLARARAIATAEKLPLLAVSHEGDVEGADATVVIQNWSEAAIVAVCEAQDARLLVFSEIDSLDWRTMATALAERLSCSLLRIEA